ncbi:NAD(P)/FAD-dependent oxidoreductase [Acidimicrobiia bacterium EGI L10123]|uniref:flavin-containing monooxygenase n=1 Tax=Salinilacustrithrix flava TaxID=2957203 RepID=UPI003D7C311E|nr:NAD(P)/FAD-dependent oxidoreductase [Acidimicrobiia bacterium EGI L10123]
MASEAGTEAEVDAVVVGAGFAGLYMLHKLRDDLGLKTRVLEAASGVGGTWHWNRFPGARCDSDAYVYCYSFDEELLQEWDWSGKYPTQPEILSYLEHVAERYDLNKDITFNTFVDAAHFNSADRVWEIQTRDGEIVRARYFITAIGHLTIARYVPDLPGLRSFDGEWFHTSAWPEGVDLKGKRVGIIGTGSTGVQAIPVIAEEAEHLVVFQRTPQYVVPACHETVDEAFLAEVKANYPEIWERSKWSAGGFPWQHNGLSALDVDDRERWQVYERLWAEGGQKFAIGSYKDILMDRRANDTVSEFIRAKVRELVQDEDLLWKLLPADHPYMARRPIIGTHYYETFSRTNVTLADVKHYPIIEVTPDGIETEEGHFALDVIVFATGFDALTGPFFNIDIRGEGGLSLQEAWRDGPSGYLGLLTSGFPNMFMITGPTSAQGNAPVAIEHHVEWIADCIDYMRQEGVELIQPYEDLESEWVQGIRRRADRSLKTLSDSWQNGSNIPGKPHMVLSAPGHFGMYRKTTDEEAAQGYPHFMKTKAIVDSRLQSSVSTRSAQ